MFKMNGILSLSIVKIMLIAQLFVTLVTCSQYVLGGVSNSTDDDSDGTRIAVIGAGAGGSSFSYYLQRYTSHRYNITVFESSGYIGGRSTTIGNYARSLGNITDDQLLNSDIELGGSVFVSQNLIMSAALETFNLSYAEDAPAELYPDLFDGSIGVWDGSKFRVTFSDDNTISSLYNSIKMIIKYNFSIFRLSIDLENYINTFIGYFYEAAFPFSLESIVELSGLTQLTGSYASTFMKTAKHWYADNFLQEIVEPSTRVNYVSNLDDIHTFGTFISMAATSAGAVAGGNYLVFENFLEYSEANVLLETTVTKIAANDDGTYTVHYDNDESAKFDQVVIAAPLQFTGIEFTGVDISLKDVEYRTVYATYVQTPRTNMLNNAQFGSGTVPELVMTTSNDSIPFFDVNLVSYDADTDKVIYKIFTSSAVDESLLSEQLFSDTTDVSIIFSKEWKAYPRLAPTTEFDGFEVADNLWYLNSMERFISTMETAALAGASVAGLIAEGHNTEDIVVP